MPYTEFCCRSGASNLNAGTRSGDTTEPGTSSVFAYASGSWVQATGVFTVASGNPLTDGVAVGDFASVFPDAATVTPFVGRVTARDATTITVSLTAKAGTAPVNGTTNTSLRIGGAWKGPNGAENFPFGFVTNTLVNAAGYFPRVNFKNAASFNVTAAVVHNLAGPTDWWGYKTAYGDGSNDPTADKKAVFDGGVVGASYNLLQFLSNCSGSVCDLIVQNNGATGAACGIEVETSLLLVRRCVGHHLRGQGAVSFSGSSVMVDEVETYACCAVNTGGMAGIAFSGRSTMVRCNSHDNTGNNVNGYYVDSTDKVVLIDCISAKNGGSGVRIPSAGRTEFCGLDCYGNGTDGINHLVNVSISIMDVENANFVKNGAGGVAFTGASGLKCGVIHNCGFGSGTQANTSGAVIGTHSLDVQATVTYPDNRTPQVNPVIGDFRINLGDAVGRGRGLFTQVQAGYAGTVGFPEIGAVRDSRTRVLPRIQQVAGRYRSLRR